MLHVLFLLMMWCPSSWASQPDTPAPTGEMGLFGSGGKDKGGGDDEAKSEEEKAAEEAAEHKRKAKLARVIVLKWPDTTTGHQDPGVVRNVKSRIARPEAMFFPEVDLYQSGRKLPDKTVIPAMQPAVVPDSNIPRVLAEVNRVGAIPWNALQPAQWGLEAQRLRKLAEEIWFVDRVILREPLFLLYAQIGRAAENQNYPAPPFYVEIGAQHLNTYFYYAALLAYQEPALMSKLTDQDTHASVQYLLTQLQQGRMPTFTLDFMLESQFSREQFGKEYELYINGLPMEVDSKGQMDAFLGLTDIYLKRKDTGHGLSERLELTIRDEKIYFVRDAARKLMGHEFIDQLFLNREECYPELSGDILNYLAIYAKLHKKAEIYVAVAENGNPNKVWIWRYDRKRAMLSKVGGGRDAFPVRFVFVPNTGVLYSGVNLEVEKDFEPATEIDLVQAGVAGVGKELTPSWVPVNIELRGHYQRLMVNVGLEFGWNAGEGQFLERYRTPQHKGAVTDPLPIDGHTQVTTDEDVVETYHKTDWNRYSYFGLGVVLGRDAAMGFGPRFAARMGWLNLPHAMQSTLHFGWAIQPPIPDFKKDRVRPLVDVDLRGGIARSLEDSFHTTLSERSEDKARIEPVFGMTAGAGITF